MVHRFSDDLFPPYAFVSGLTPHPESDPRGHSFGVPRSTAVPLDPDHWQDCPAYLFGIDLFNAGFWWEAHVQWESLWIAAGRKGPVATFLKGLIALAAAGFKQRASCPAGVHSHAGRACRLFRTLSADRVAGLSVGALIELAEGMEQQGWPKPSPVLLPQA
jgi:uncharacterized protein